MKTAYYHRTNTGMNPCIPPLAMARLMTRIARRRNAKPQASIASRILAFLIGGAA